MSDNKPDINGGINLPHIIDESSINILMGLVKKNLYGKYKNSILGLSWHIILPLLLIAIYYIAFNSLSTKQIDNFSIYLISGIFPFTFMMTNLLAGTSCICENGFMIKKISVNRELFVWAQIISSSVVLFIGLIISITIAICSGIKIDLMALLAIPIFILVLILFVSGYVLLLSALNVYVRDIQHFLTSIVVIFYFITPIYFRAEDTSDMLKTIVQLNPFSYFVELMHSCIYEGTLPSIEIITICVLISIISLIIGKIVFTKLKNGFAEKL